MNIAEIKSRIENGHYDSDFARLYSDVTAARTRYAEACDEFAALYGDRDNIRLFSAPGRTEIGGNHTDHQHGLVLAGSAELDVIAIVSENGSDIINIKSAGFPMDTLSIKELDIDASEAGRASALIRGVCAAFKNDGYSISGFDAYTTSNVLKGSGLSSSAAFEVLVSNIINGLFCNNAADSVTMAKYSQFAERDYFGKPCGLLDQTASAVGGLVFIDFFDKAAPRIEKLSVDFSAFGHCLCVTNTGGSHADLTDEYASIPGEMKAVSAFFGKENLSTVGEEEFLASIVPLRAEVGDRPLLRAMHFFAETRRAYEEARALKDGRFSDFLALVKESGRSSFEYLQNVYAPKCPEAQALPLALALSERQLGGAGAFRVHGGGFAGTTLALVPSSSVDGYRSTMEAVFGEGSCHTLSIRPYGGIAVTAE